MIRDDDFRISRRPYAVDLGSLDTSSDHGHVTMRAAWFRRRKGVAVTCLGTLWDYQRPVPTSAAEFLARHDDGRYGGSCEARWDGTGFWGPEDPDTAGGHLAFLRVMLAAYPRVPAGHDGWWRF